MIEDSFLRLYASDFVSFAAKAEQGQDVATAVQRRMDECRSHAELMDRRKGEGHLAAMSARMSDEAERFSGRGLPRDQDPAPAAARHRAFLLDIARTLSDPAPAALVDDMDMRVRPRP
jgi:hypothetical protein